ncbi:MAG: hypothetical protein AABX33_03020 [Nanoarchaeota archaeon]
MTKCSECKENKEDIKFYSNLNAFKDLVFFKPVCVSCSKQIVKESGGQFNVTQFMNKVDYKRKITLYVITSFIILFFGFYQLSRVGEWHIIIWVWLFLLMIVFPLIFLILIGRTIKKYGF